MTWKRCNGSSRVFILAFWSVLREGGLKDLSLFLKKRGARGALRRFWYRGR